MTAVNRPAGLAARRLSRKTVVLTLCAEILAIAALVISQAGMPAFSRHGAPTVTIEFVPSPPEPRRSVAI